jgi:hypothetical protein
VSVTAEVVCCFEVDGGVDLGLADCLLWAAGAKGRFVECGIVCFFSVWRFVVGGLIPGTAECCVWPSDK